MTHDTFTHLRRLDAGEQERAMQGTFQARQIDGFAATERGTTRGIRPLLATMLRSIIRRMEWLARTLDQAHLAQGGEFTSPTHEGSAP